MWSARCEYSKCICLLSQGYLSGARCPCIRREVSRLSINTLINIHSIFHISLLRKNLDDFFFEQIIFSSSSIMINDEQKFDIENILNSRLINKSFNKRLQYKMRWFEHFLNRKWYWTKNFDHVKKIVIDYHNRYLNKFESHLIIISLINHRIKNHQLNTTKYKKRKKSNSKNC